jgi:hypothetical protein
MMIKYFKHYVILFTFMMFVGCVPSYYSTFKKDLDKYYLDNIVIQPKGFIERYVCVNVGEPKNLTLQIK